MQERITELGACNVRSNLVESGSHHVLSLAAQKFMAGEAIQFMSEFEHQSILLQFSADSTPIRCREALRVSTSVGVRVNRRGKRSLDFQVMACSLTTPLAGDGSQSILLFREPVSLSTKKASGLSGSFMKCPGVLGVGSSEEAIRIRHQVYDAGVAESCIHIMSGKWSSE
eukprot:6455917-Amphidinium_carterae.1